MTISRREFCKILGSLMGGWVLALPKASYLDEMIRMPAANRDLEGPTALAGLDSNAKPQRGLDCAIPHAYLTPSSWEWDICITPDSQNLLDEIGVFNTLAPGAFVFDESKYAPLKRNLEPSEWNRTNRHLPIKIDPDVVNKPGERSPQALKRVVSYIPFRSPRYVAAPGERVSLCNIAAWDWSRALQVHLPHWKGDTEMSANMLFRWITHPQAGGVYGEGWQPVEAEAAQLLANRGVPVFALVENTTPGRHGHVALVYPDDTNTQGNFDLAELSFATVTNGRSSRSNGIRSLQDTFRWRTPTYFVHNSDFILNQGS